MAYNGKKNLLTLLINAYIDVINETGVINPAKLYRRCPDGKRNMIKFVLYISQDGMTLEYILDWVLYCEKRVNEDRYLDNRTSTLITQGYCNHILLCFTLHTSQDLVSFNTDTVTSNQVFQRQLH